MVTLLKSKIGSKLSEKESNGIANKHAQRFKYCLLALCTCLYISVFASSSERPIQDMDIEQKNTRSMQYFDQIPVAKESAYGVFFEGADDIIVVSVED